MSVNTILQTDSYKLGHWKQYPQGTRGVYSYLEARTGAQFDKTVFFGLQSILKQLEGEVVTRPMLYEAEELAEAHFGTPDLFNYHGWERIIDKHKGRLPVRIKAVAEGTPVEADNVLMTVENTDPDAFWLTNALESLLLHVWYPTTVASLSYDTKQMLRRFLRQTGGTEDGLPFMLHDFGFRGATTSDAAAIGGAGHLVNFLGTDTLPAILLAKRDYAATEPVGLSVPATEHSIMTSLGPVGERRIVADLIDNHPTGILSVVADSFNIYRFVDELGTIHKERVLARDGKFVVRPDSVTDADPTPASLVVNLLGRLFAAFGGTTNDAGFRVLNPKVGLIWGDGINPDGIEQILDAAAKSGYAAENLVFGMGGGLLQKVNRDTQRFAFKSSAQLRNGVWVPVSKNPLDASKRSKEGRLALVHDNATGRYKTVKEDEAKNNVLMTVFEDGKLVNETTFDRIRENAA